MKAYDYEAVVIDCTILCIECLPQGVSVDSEDVSPIFADSEWDRYPVCDKCGYLHNYVNLTDDGRQYETEQAGPQTDDIVISNLGHLGSKYHVQIVDGESLGIHKSLSHVECAIKGYFEESNCSSNVWMISDHGNHSLLTF